jgi:predicted dehydrogenase
LDKPLAGSREHVRQIVDAVRQSAGVAHMFSAFTSTAVGRVRHVMEAGRLGRLLAVHCDYCFAKGYAGTATLGTPRRESPRPDRYELADAKRELTNIGVYPLVMLLTLLGRTPRRVAAATGNFFFAEHQSRDMEDFGHLLLEFEDGVIASVAAGRTGWLSHPRDGLNRTYLIGSEASVVIEPDAPRLELWSDAASWTPPPRNPEDPMGMWPAADDSPFRPAPKTAWMAAPALSPVNDAKYFLDCIEHGHDSEVPVEVAAGASEILFAAYQSAATGQPVDLPLS